MAADLVNQFVELVKQGQQVLSNPAVAGAFGSLVDWLKDKFKNNKRAQQRLEMLQRLEASEEEINRLKTNIDDLLYENEQLKQEFAQKLKELEEQLKNAGVNITKTNQVTVTNSSNVIVANDISASNVQINVNKD